MKGLKVSLVITAAALLTVGVTGLAYAFHSGGVAECGGCHSMHNPNQSGSYLLIGIDASSTCLECHQHAGDTGPSSYHVSTAETDMPAGTAPLQRNPGGDFGWVKKTYIFTLRGTLTTELGETHGHNIIASDKNYVADSVNTTSPGGTFSNSDLGCNVCHNPHGKYRRLTGNNIATSGAPIKASGSYPNPTTNEPDASNAVGVYRLLQGGAVTSGATTLVTFPGVPAAKVPSSYNRTEAATTTRVAYGTATSGGTGHTTWGRWCSSCHQNMHGDSGRFVHPVDQGLGSTVSGIYNDYVRTGKTDGAFDASTPGPYTSLVPFATPAVYTDLATLAVNDNTQLGGPTATSTVVCLSCHRAHASGWEFGLRWNMEGELLTVNGAYPVNATHSQFARGRTQTEIQAAYYDRPATYFATYQRVLCNKCHAKD